MYDNGISTMKQDVYPRTYDDGPCNAQAYHEQHLGGKWDDKRDVIPEYKMMGISMTTYDSS